jgi:phosphoribosylformylglycinamidine synthase
MSSSTTASDAWRVEVFKRTTIHDPEGDKALHEVHELGLEAITSIRVGHGYLLSPELDQSEASLIASELLTDPVLEEVKIFPPGIAPSPAPAGSRRVLVAPKPGVMDPIADSVTRIARRTGNGGSSFEVQTFRVFEMHGDAPTDELEKICRRTLANVTIDTLRIDREDLPFGAPKGHGETRGHVEVSMSALDDAGLEKLSVQGELSLTLMEMQEIQKFYKDLGREPSACELETLAQTWSEHCKHKTFAGLIDFVDHSKEGSPTERIDNLLKSTIKRATEELDVPWCVSVFHDNAGIIEFDAGYDISFKVETHNHPSAIDPYGGAGTGIGGVIRDILGVGLGARPIANTDAFFVGMPDMPMKDLPKGCMHPRRILRGVVGGVRDYGNRMGIPTISGGLWFDNRYVGNPLVYAGTVGLAKREFAHKTIEPGDLVVTLGGAVGRDGIHGATFSSIELTEDSEEDSASSVQIGNPIQEKRVLDAMLQARDRGLFRAVTDCGAGGLSSAVGEMGEEGGVDVDLAKVPLKYPGLASHEIWISEAQERMVLAVQPENIDELLALCASEDVAATVIGTFNDTKRLVVRDAGEVICDIEMAFLHDGTPRYLRHAVWTPPTVKDPGCPAPSSKGETYNSALLGIVGAPDVRSKEWIIRQYDHEVQGNTVIKPLVGAKSDAPGNGSVIKPLAESKKGVAIGCGANPRMGLLDPYAMAGSVIDEAMRNVVAVGGDPTHTAILDNFSWGNCAKPENLGSLVLASKACYDVAMAFGTPFISGKDSLNNEFRVGDETIIIPPTLLLSAMSVVQDVSTCVTMDAKEPGNLIYLVGETKQDMGASHYLHHLGLDGGRVPQPDLQRAPTILKAMHSAIHNGLVASCHDLSEGGLAVAAAEMAFGGGLGMDLHLSPMADPEGFMQGSDRDAVLLFSESCTRFLVEVTPGHAKAFEREFNAAGLEGIALPIGEVTAGSRLYMRGKDSADLIEIDIEDLRAAHTGGFKG